jgi:hypothetical protein
VSRQKIIETLRSVLNKVGVVGRQSWYVTNQYWGQVGGGESRSELLSFPSVGRGPVQYDLRGKSVWTTVRRRPLLYWSLEASPRDPFALQFSSMSSSTPLYVTFFNLIQLSFFNCLLMTPLSFPTITPISPHPSPSLHCLLSSLNIPMLVLPFTSVPYWLVQVCFRPSCHPVFCLVFLFFALLNPPPRRYPPPKFSPPSQA